MSSVPQPNDLSFGTKLGLVLAPAAMLVAAAVSVLQVLRPVPTLSWLGILLLGAGAIAMIISLKSAEKSIGGTE